MIKKTILLTLLSVLILNSCTSGGSDSKYNSTNDSIKKYLDMAGNDSLPYQKRIQYNDKAYALIDVNKNDTLTRSNINEVVTNYLKTENWIDYNKTSKTYFHKCIEAKDSIGIARCYKYKAEYFGNNKVIDSAFYYYLKAENIYKKSKDKVGLGQVYLYKSCLQYNIDDYLGSELSAKKSYNCLKNSTKYYDIYCCLINIGSCYHSQKQYYKAIKSIKNALSFVVHHRLSYLPRNSPKLNCLNNIGNAYRELKQYKKAINYFTLALSDKKNIIKYPETMGYLLNNLGYCYMQTKTKKRIPSIFFMTERLFNSLGIKNEQSVCNMYLSEYYLQIKDTTTAIKYSEKALKIAKESKAPYYYLTALSRAGSINRQSASLYIKEYHQINDSLISLERNSRNQYFKIQLETDEITHEKEKAIQQKWIIASISVCLILIFILIFIISYQRSKQKELTLLQAQQQANEAIYLLLLNQKTKEEEIRQTEKKRIALELHDGIMNKLSSTRLNLSILSHKTDALTIQKCLEYINTIYQIEQDIRIISHDLNHEAFQNEDSFVPLLEDLVAEQNKTSTTVFTLELDPEINWEIISSLVKINIYRILQEAFQNIKKYAEANNAYITFTLDLPNLCMSITDDGIGFDTTLVSKGIGIQNMKARVISLKGKFNISSSLHQNTSISIAIPIVSN
jgi:signal transduction histidine kinase